MRLGEVGRLLENVIQRVSFPRERDGSLTINIEYVDGWPPEAVAAAEYRLAIELLGMTQLMAARLLGFSARTSRRYASGEQPAPRKLMMCLWLEIHRLLLMPDEKTRWFYEAIYLMDQELRWRATLPDEERKAL